MSTFETAMPVEADIDQFVCMTNCLIRLFQRVAEVFTSFLPHWECLEPEALVTGAV